MALGKFGQYTIFRPSKHVEKSTKKIVEKMLFKKYKSGVYTDYKTINEITKFMMDFYSNMLDDNLNKIASIELMKFVLNEYNTTCKITRSISLLADEEYSKWKQLGGILRRALKFIAEKITMINPQDEIIKINKHEKEEIISKVFIAAEEMAQMYMSSDSTYRVFKEETTLTLSKDKNIYWNLEVNNSYIQNQFPPAIKYDELLGNNIQIDLDISFINNELNEGFMSKFGKSLCDIRNIIININNNYNEDEVPFVKKDNIVDFIKNNYGTSHNTAESILSGFIITQKDLMKENRQIYSPKQEYRALTRGFFEINYQNEKYLTWSKNMADENFVLLVRGICYKKMPNEWRNKEINTSIEHITNKVGAWFEKETNKQLKKLNINGNINFKNEVGNKEKFISIPSEVGEIDYLGIDLENHELIVGECKMISPALEPRLFYDDIRKFMDGKEGYIKKFNNKIKWISDNRQEILKCLLNYLHINMDDEEISKINQKNILFTFYPSIIEAFDTEFEICTLYKFIKNRNI